MKTSKKLAVLAGLVGVLGGASAWGQSCAPVTYTLDADFDLGTLFNVNHNAPNNDQLQLNTVISAFPNLWIANAGEDTVSKLDANTGKEVARYRTWFNGGIHGAWSGPAPSRTAVDGAGNVYALNRHFDGRPALLVKILTTGGIDRNGNSQIDTSVDLNNDGVISGAELIPLTDANSNGKLDPAELADERVAWAVEVGPANGLGRSCSIDPNGDIWVGLYNSQAYYKVSGATGAILAGPIPTPGHTPYGSLVDGNGILWGASLGSSLLRLDTTDLIAPYTVNLYYHSGGNYGIAIGPGKVYLGNTSLNSYTVFDIGTSTFSQAPSAISTLGITVDGAGNIYTGDAVGGGGTSGAAKFRPDGSVIWSTGTSLGGTDQRGAILDSNGDLWTVVLSHNRVEKYNGATGANLGTYPVGASPYTYSDASGQSFLVSNPSGTWTVVQDGGAAGQAWGTVSWTASVPVGTSLSVEVRAADTVGGLAVKTFQSVGNGLSFCTANVVGRYLEIKATLTSTGNTSPILYDLTVTPCDNFPPATDCSYVQSAAHRITTLTAIDNCDPSPKIYLKDSASGFVAGPFANGDKVLVRTNPNQAPFSRPGPAPYKATIQLKGTAQVYGVDSNGNVSTPTACHKP